MILVTDPTSYVGRAVVHHLVSAHYETVCMMQPSRRALRLPTGVAFSAVSASFQNPPTLRAMLQNVDAVVHLIGEESLPRERSLADHPRETAALLEAMRESGVSRLIYLSRVGAEPASAYPLLRIRGETEGMIRESGLDYTILQPAVTYGAEDSFTIVLAMMAKTVPFVVPVPDAGLARFQPLWVGDLARCVGVALERSNLVRETIAIGGPEHFTLEQMVLEVLEVLALRRLLLHVRMPLMRAASSLFDLLFVRNPLPLWMLDIVTKGSATDLGAVSRHFRFEPCRFSHCLAYLHRRRPWRRDLIRFLLGLR